jgi:hypothetical protein
VTLRHLGPADDEILENRGHDLRQRSDESTIREIVGDQARACHRDPLTEKCRLYREMRVTEPRTNGETGILARPTNMCEPALPASSAVIALGY